MYIPKINLTLAGQAVTDELWSDVGAGVLLLGHDAFFGNSEMEIYTGPGKTGTKLTETTDYVLLNEDADLTARAGAAVYTAIQIVNATYQSGALYFTYKAIADYAAIDDINAIKCLTGAKVGMEIYLAGSDDLRITAGFLHVNNGRDHYLQTDTETLLTGESALAGWKYVTVNNTGAVNIRNATGNADQRPTDSYFQWSGYIHDKGGYYYNASERIIGAIYRVSSSSWYIINCGEDGQETGENLIGSWERAGKIQMVHGRLNFSCAISTAVGSMFTSPTKAAAVWPVEFLPGVTPQVSYAATSTGFDCLISSVETPTATGHNGVYLMRPVTDPTSRARYVDFIAIGKWR